MERWIFILVFGILGVGFLYSPKGVMSAPQGFCFVEDVRVIPATENPGERVTAFVYEDVPAEWKFRVFDSSASVIVKKISNNEIISEEVIPSLTSVSDDNCKYYTFDFQRSAGNLNYDILLDREEVGSDGRKKCVYKITSEISDKINSLGGLVISDLSQVCPDLQSGRPVSEGDECPLTAECGIEIFEGGEEKFGFGFEKDSCGGRFVFPDNNGARILSSEIELRAAEFVERCDNRKSSSNDSIGIRGLELGKSRIGCALEEKGKTSNARVGGCGAEEEENPDQNNNPSGLSEEEERNWRIAIAAKISNCGKISKGIEIKKLETPEKVECYDLVFMDISGTYKGQRYGGCWECTDLIDQKYRDCLTCCFRDFPDPLNSVSIDRLNCDSTCLFSTETMSYSLEGTCDSELNGGPTDTTPPGTRGG